MYTVLVLNTTRTKLFNHAFFSELLLSDADRTTRQDAVAEVAAKYLIAVVFVAIGLSQNLETVCIKIIHVIHCLCYYYSLFYSKRTLTEARN